MPTTRKSRRSSSVAAAIAVLIVVTLVWTNLIFLAGYDEHNDKDEFRMGPTDSFYQRSSSHKKSTTNTNTNTTAEKPLEIDITIDDGPLYPAPIVNPNTRDFDPTINGVIVTKMQGGTKDVDSMKQMLCLLTKAYNDRVHHDILVFTSEPIASQAIEEFQKLVHPANLTVAIDNPGLHSMVQTMDLSQQQKLLERCNVTKVQDLTWRTMCWEVGSYTTHHEMLSYNWQAEFRAKWLWEDKLLKPYRYMMWVDSDAFCTRVWKQDPFAAMQRHDLVLLFDHFPQGMARGYEFPRLTRKVFDRTICKIDLVNGTLVAMDGRCQNRPKGRIKNIHGFFHLTDLDFYRSSKVREWNHAMITDDHKFSRLFDDQIGTTIPAAVLAGNRTRDMKGLGLYLRVFHNYFLDGRHPDHRGYFVNWWDRNADTIFPEANGKCPVKLNG